MLFDLSFTTGTLIIVSFFFVHWFLSAFSQTFFLHRYSSHRMFEMSNFWEKFFFFLTFFSQGSSFLNPRGYAVLHRMHHAHSDTENDPHSPHFFEDVFQMMWHTKKIYQDCLARRGKFYELAQRFDKNYPEWPTLERVGDSWMIRALFCLLYTLFYVCFAPSPFFFVLLPIHFLMGPVHGAAVNWMGHKYGYRNWNTDDHSRNTTPWDFVLLGELFQNNHHKDPGRANFAMKKFEFDLTYPMMKTLHWMRIIRLKPRATGY